VGTEESGEPVDGPQPAVVEVRDLVQLVKGRRGLLRRRRAETVLDGVSFTIAPGSVVVYADRSDVGQSALVDLVVGTAAPTAGTVTTLGRRPDTSTTELAGRVGVAGGSHTQLWRDLAVDDSLRILATAHGLSEERWAARRGELVERLGLAAFVNLSAAQLSPGRRIRAEVAAALIHQPELLVLDRPMLGLDVAGKERLRSFLQDENRLHHRTVLLTTDDLGDVEPVAGRLLVVDKGRLVHDGGLPDLFARAGVDRVLVVDLLDPDLLLDDVPGARLVEVEAGGRRQRLSFTPGGVPASRVLADVASRAGIRHLAVEEPRLEELVRRL
jgi:ABC-2 type transport system ATP-binding protein